MVVGTGRGLETQGTRGRSEVGWGGDLRLAGMAAHRAQRARHVWERDA